MSLRACAWSEAGTTGEGWIGRHIPTIVGRQRKYRPLAFWRVLGDVLREERARAKLTQETLAAKAGVSRNYISLLELNQKSPTLQMLCKICKVLKVRPSTVIARIEGNDWK